MVFGQKVCITEENFTNSLMIPNIYREGYTSDEEVERVIQIGKISGRVFFERTNLGGSIQGTGDLRGRRSSGQDGRSPLAWRNT